MIFYFVTTILIIIMWCISNSLETRYKVYALITAQVTYLIVASVHKLELLRIININYFQTNGMVLFKYHGGTNFGRTSSSYVLTAYYDQAPLDEYGMFLTNGTVVLLMIKFQY